jgi:aldehyde:ferredoxin oxidoreductase
MTHRKRDTVLTVDLTSGTTDREQVPARWLRQYLGGKGLGARYLYDRLDPATGPLDPDNLLAYMFGPLSGYLPGEPRYAVVTKSPLTGTFLDSYSGGRFVERLAGALEDCLGVLVTGRADRPVRLEIENGSCRIRPADNWGADTVETANAFPDAGVACVGPAGEQGVIYATIASDGGDHHAGRGGAGTVMGNKRLKAIVARGEPPEPGPELARLRDRYERAYVDHDTGQWQAAGGTFESVDFANEIGALATEGWQQTQFDSIAGIGVEAASDSAVDRESGAVPGDFRFETDDGEVVLRGAAPMTLGAGLGIDHVGDVARLAGTCDRLGVDVIDAGNAIAWTIRANEAGLVDYPVEFGDVDGAQALIEAIATHGTGGRPEGAGDDGRGGDELETAGGAEVSALITVLARGVDAASERFGGTGFIPTVKSMAFPSYDPRGSPGMALAYATSDRGACHRRARPIETETAAGTDWSIRDRVRVVVGEQTVRSVLWSLIIDDFVGETMWEDLGQEWLASIDRPYTTRELVRTGQRIWTLTRLFNAREGFDRSADTVPDEILAPGPDGPTATSPGSGEFERTLDAYYRARGWGPNGLPTRETLDRLDLLDVVDDETPLDEPW